VPALFSIKTTKAVVVVVMRLMRLMQFWRRRNVLVLLFVLLLVPTAGGWTWPVQGPVLQTFSFDPAHPYAAGQHRGIAIGAGEGTPVLAPAAGVVSFAGTVPTSGKTITIQTPSGLAVSLTHLGSIGVARNASVDEGAAVGTVGPSGTPEFDGPYVHLGVRDAANDQGYLDPLAFLPVLAPPMPAPMPAPAPAPVAAPVAPVAAPVAAPAEAPVAVPVAPVDVPVPAPATQPIERPVPAPVLAAPQPVAAPAPAVPAAPAVEPPAAPVALPSAPVTETPAPSPSFPLQAPVASPGLAAAAETTEPPTVAPSPSLPALALSPPESSPNPVAAGSPSVPPALAAFHLPDSWNGPVWNGPVAAIALRPPSALRLPATPMASRPSRGFVRPLPLGLAGALLAAVGVAVLRMGRRRRPPAVVRLRAVSSPDGGRLAA
jgi:hypothetical protein